MDTTDEKRTLAISSPSIPDHDSNEGIGEAAGRGASSSRSLHGAFGWTKDFVMLTISAVAFFAMVVLLRCFHDKPQPEWPYSLTLNGLLQVLVTLAQVCFSAALVQALSQVKWLWFASAPRPLMHFQVYEDACRGGFAPYRLLWRVRGAEFQKQLLVSLAAVVMISALFTAPVTQLAITTQTELRPSANGTATVPRATALSRVKGASFEIEYSDLLSIREALISPTYLGASSNMSHLEPKCSSADCSWEVYGSLGVCGKVKNVTGMTNKTLLSGYQTIVSSATNLWYNTTNITQYALSQTQNDSFHAMYHLMIFPVTEPPRQFEDYVTEASISEFIIAYADKPLDGLAGVNGSQFQFLDVAFYYCGKSFNTSVVGGTHRTVEVEEETKLLSSSIDTLNFAWKPEFTMEGSYCPSSIMSKSATFASPTSASGPETYTVEACTGLSLSGALFLATGGMAIVTPKLKFLTSVGELSYPISVALFGDQALQRPSDPSTKFRNVEHIVGNIATSLTSLFRRNGDTLTGSNGTFSGMAYTPQAIVKFRWPWLSLLAAQICLCAVVLSLTIAMTRSSGVRNLGDSAIATMCVLDQGTREELGPLIGSEDFNGRTRDISVKLEVDNAGSVLWLAEQNRRSERAPPHVKR